MAISLVLPKISELKILKTCWVSWELFYYCHNGLTNLKHVCSQKWKAIFVDIKYIYTRCI